MGIRVSSSPVNWKSQWSYSERSKKYSYIISPIQLRLWAHSSSTGTHGSIETSPSRGRTTRQAIMPTVRSTTNGILVCNCLQMSPDAQGWLQLVQMMAIHLQSSTGVMNTLAQHKSFLFLSFHIAQFKVCEISWLQLEKVGQVSETGWNNYHQKYKHLLFLKCKLASINCLLFFHKAYSFSYKCKKILHSVEAIFPTDWEEREKNI